VIKPDEAKGNRSVTHDWLYWGQRGLFAYQAFDWANKTLFDNQLPWLLIQWALMPHGGCLGHTLCRRAIPPVITLHPSLFGATEKGNPWGCARSLPRGNLRIGCPDP
jgi:hypothetical protein